MIKVKPAGLIKPLVDPKYTIENVELRAALDKAVKDAKLNEMEIWALNETFFPDGGGFELFPKNIQVPQLNTFRTKASAQTDTFTREAEQNKYPEYVSRIRHCYASSEKSDYQTNLDNALKKLYKVLKGHI